MAYETASFTQGATHSSVQVLAGGTYTTRKVTILSGQVLVEGSVIGAVTEGARTAVGAAGVPAPAAATITASPTAAITTKVGVHSFVCIVGGSGTASKWRHIDPDGEYVGVATGATAYGGGGLSGITIADPGTDPTPGETFTVTVTAADGSDKYKLSLAAATDGSEVPDMVLCYAVDASGGDVEALAYETAPVNASGLTLGTGHTVASIREALRLKGILIDD